MIKRKAKHLAFLSVLALMMVLRCFPFVQASSPFDDWLQQCEEQGYPDFYGGRYGNKVYFLAEDAISGNLDQYFQVKGWIESDGIVIETVAFSYNDLNATMEILDSMALSGSRPQAFDNANWWRPDLENNRITVGLFSCGEEEINRFKETILDSPMIIFEEDTVQYVPYDGAGSTLPNGIWVLLIVFGLLAILVLVFLVWQRKRRASAIAG